MPTTPLDDSAGWASLLQSLIANQGAAQPYGPSGYPDNLPNMASGPPGGGLMGYSGATPGAPSMGYPALGQNAGRPSVAPGFIGGAPSSVQGGPFTGGGVPGSGPAPLAIGLPGGPLHKFGMGPVGATGPGGLPNSVPTPMYNGGPPSSVPTPMYNGGPAAPVAPSGSGGIGSDARFPLASTPMGQGGIGSDARFPIAGPLAAPAGEAPGPVDPSIIARKKLMKPASSPASTATAPPSAAPSSAFVPIDRPNMSATGYNPGPRQMTALNLARLFGRA